jgi:hypothetical protein
MDCAVYQWGSLVVVASCSCEWVCGQFKNLLCDPLKQACELLQYYWGLTERFCGSFSCNGRCGSTYGPFLCAYLVQSMLVSPEGQPWMRLWLHSCVLTAITYMNYFSVKEPLWIWSIWHFSKCKLFDSVIMFSNASYLIH